MIIKFAKDSKSGACEYLRDGTGGDRDKKDKRVQLTLNNCQEIINEHIDELNRIGKNYKDNYKHIVLSFEELDELPADKLTQIADDFVRMYMSAYSPEDYTYYAEAHIPKIKTNESGGRRHPHIHIFIPKYSFTLKKRLHFSTQPRRLKELELIKEILIEKHGLQRTERKKILNRESYKKNRNYKNSEEKQQIIDDLYYTLKNTDTIKTHKELIQYLYKKYDLKYVKQSKNAKTPYVTLIFKDGRKIRLRGEIFNRDRFEESFKSLKNDNSYIYNIYNINNIKSKSEYLKELEQKLNKQQQKFKNYVKNRFYKTEEKEPSKYSNRLYRNKNDFNKKLYVFSKLLNSNYNSLKKIGINTDSYFFKKTDNNDEIFIGNKQKKIYIKVKPGEITGNSNTEDVKEQAEQMFKLAIASGKDVLNLNIEGSLEFKMHIKRLQDEYLKNLINKEKTKKRGKEDVSF